MKYIPVIAILLVARSVAYSAYGNKTWDGFYAGKVGEAVVRSTFNAPSTKPTIAAGTTLYIIDEGLTEDIWFDAFTVAFSSSASFNADPLTDVEIKFQIGGATQSFTTAMVRNLLNDVTTDRAPPGFSISTLSTAGATRAIYFSYKLTTPVRCPYLQLFVVNNNQADGIRIDAVAAQWRK